MALPSNDKIIGDLGHTADHNAIVDEIIYIKQNYLTASGNTIQDLLRRDVASATYLSISNAASAYIRVTSSAAIVSGYIPTSASQSYLTRSDAAIVYAPRASASFTGTPTAPTASPTTNTQQIATTQFVRTEITNLISSAPATLDTLNELASALGNDPNFATSTASAIGQRLLASTASTLYMPIGSTANHATSASTINWSGITGLAQFPDGTAAAPSITNTGDNNTGIFFPEEDTIAFSEGGAEVMRINAAAQVVIPGGTSASPALTRAGGTTTGIFFPDGAQMAFSTQGTERWRIDSGGTFRSSTNVSFQPQIQIKNTNTDTSAGYLIFQKSPTDNTLVLNDILGNVIFQGIGTDGVDKTSALIVAAADGPNTASNVPSSIRFSTSTGTTSTPERMRITSVGNVGIGTTNPNRTLSVIGTASFTGDISAPTFSGLLLGNAISASSVNWAGITGRPTTLSGYGITDAASLNSPNFIGVPTAPTASAGSSSNQIANTEFVNSAILSVQSGSFINLNSYLKVDSASVLYLGINNTANHARTASSISWSLVTNRPSASPSLNPQIGVNLVGDITGAASATLTSLSNGQISISTNISPDSVVLGTDTTGNYVAGATAGNGITISGTAGEGWSPTIALNAAASVSWGNISSKPSPIIGVNLTGAVTGAASATLNNLSNTQITINTEQDIVINQQTTASYTLQLSDSGKLITMNNSNGNLVIIPLESSINFPIGSKIDITQIGTGTSSITFDSGVTLNSDSNKKIINTRYTAVSLVKLDSDSWILIGALKS